MIKIFLWLVQEGTQGPLTGLSVWLLIRLGFFLFCFIRGWALLVFSLSIFCRQVFFSLLAGLFRLFSLCSSFPFLFALFCLKVYPFPPPFFGFVSTFAGAGFSHNLADLLLGSPFAAPSAGLTFLVGILAAGRARAGAPRALCPNFNLHQRNAIRNDKNWDSVGTIILLVSIGYVAFWRLKAFRFSKTSSNSPTRTWVAGLRGLTGFHCFALYHSPATCGYHTPEMRLGHIKTCYQYKYILRFQRLHTQKKVK